MNRGYQFTHTRQGGRKRGKERGRERLDAHSLVGVNFAVLHLRTHLRKQDLEFLDGPIQDAGEQTHAQPLQTFGVARQLELGVITISDSLDELGIHRHSYLSNLLQLLALRPWVHWNLVYDLMYILESSFFHPRLEFVVVWYWAAVFEGGVAHQGHPLRLHGVSWQSSVVGREIRIEFLEFEVTTWFDMP